MKLIGEPVGAELRALEEQLARAKALSSEFVANGRLIDAAKQACTSLLRSLEGQQSSAEMKAIEGKPLCGVSIVITDSYRDQLWSAESV